MQFVSRLKLNRKNKKIKWNVFAIKKLFFIHVLRNKIGRNPSF